MGFEKLGNESKSIRRRPKSARIIKNLKIQTSKRNVMIRLVTAGDFLHIAINFAQPGLKIVLVRACYK